MNGTHYIIYDNNSLTQLMSKSYQKSTKQVFE